MLKASAKTIQKLSNIIQAFPEVKRTVQILAVGGGKSIVKLILNFNVVGF